jgi:hypothetical protein
VILTINEPSIEIGSAEPVEIIGDNVSKLYSWSMELVQDDLEKLQNHLHEYSESCGLFRDLESSPLPPLRDINHEILLIDEKKIYPWRLARCPDVFKEQWVRKKQQYLNTGQWRVTTSWNTVPLLCIPKPNKPQNQLELQMAIGLWAQNANTYKMSAPLPNIEAVLRRAAACPYRSLFDQKDTYKQIRIKPDHVSRTAVTTPDRNIESLVLQIGDANASATFQVLMNHIFSAYIRVFMDVYLDDIIVYSRTLKEHLEHCKLIFDTLRKETLYLSEKKLQILPCELRILGRIIDNDGV